jgi:hypothetical protein
VPLSLEKTGWLELSASEVSSRATVAMMTRSRRLSNGQLNERLPRDSLARTNEQVLELDCGTVGVIRQRHWGGNRKVEEEEHLHGFENFLRSWLIRLNILPSTNMGLVSFYAKKLPYRAICVSNGESGS